MGTTWSVDETAVAIILDMWGVEYKTIAAVLTNKRAWVRGVQEGAVAGMPATTPEYERTKSSVASKLDRMRHTHPELWSEELGQWNREAVCRFLSENRIDHGLLDYLLSLTVAELAMIKRSNSLAAVDFYTANAITSSWAGIQQRVIVELLRERNFSRTEVAVSSMLQAIQKSTGLLKRLKREKVDALVRDLLAGDNMDALLLPTVEDQMIVDRTHKNIDLLEHYLEWSKRFHDNSL
ncbi:hypothetical protein AnigIFM49718_004646 [Aspergillus niger]|nr:hypothetical protein AnigIFM49718_004646 [Aspergillus niger]